jgi:hypothetical protein
LRIAYRQFSQRHKRFFSPKCLCAPLLFHLLPFCLVCLCSLDKSRRPAQQCVVSLPFNQLLPYEK